jgi:hypothetical protein
MNIPNRRNKKTRSEPGKRQRDRTKPFSDPINVEMSVAGMTSLRLFSRKGSRPYCSPFHASLHASSDHTSGNAQARLGSASAPLLKLATSRT